MRSHRTTRRLLDKTFLILVWTCLIPAARAGSPGAEGIQRSFKITEPAGVAWESDRVEYVVEFPSVLAHANGLELRDPSGKPIACQLSNAELDTDDKSFRRGKLAFMASLHANEVGSWALRAGREPVQQPWTDLKVTSDQQQIEFSTGACGVRIPAGIRRFEKPVSAEAIPAPIQKIRLSDGRWIGRGWWNTERLCLGYRVVLEESGPVFARVRMHYDFEDYTS